MIGESGVLALPPNRSEPVVVQVLGLTVSAHDVIEHLLLTSLGVVPEVSPHAIPVRRVYPCELEPLGVSHPI